MQNHLWLRTTDLHPAHFKISYNYSSFCFSQIQSVVLLQFRINQVFAGWGDERDCTVAPSPGGSASDLFCTCQDSESSSCRVVQKLWRRNCWWVMEKVSPALPPLHSPHLAGAGPSADTSSALLLGFYLWGQAGQCATETETRESNSLAKLDISEENLISQTYSRRGKKKSFCNRI